MTKVGSPYRKGEQKNLHYQRAATLFPMGRGWLLSAKSQFDELEDSDDEVSETEGEDNVSELSCSQVNSEYDYSPGDIHSFRGKTFRKRQVRVGAIFPDLTAFLKASQQICHSSDRFGFSTQECYRLKALMCKAKKELTSAQK